MVGLKETPTVVARTWRKVDDGGEMKSLSEGDDLFYLEVLLLRLLLPKHCIQKADMNQWLIDILLNF